MEHSSEIVIYKSEDGNAAINVQLHEKTIWLTQKQIALVFGTEVPAIHKHIRNIFISKELQPKATVSKMEIVQTEGKREVKRTVELYSLDIIIAVGYRVNSKRATQFRIWANRILKEYLVKGYAVNEKRLKETDAKLSGLKTAIKLLDSVIRPREITSIEAKGLIGVIADYTLALDILDKYDHEALKISGTEKKQRFRIDVEQAQKAIDTLRKKFKSSDLFEKEKDDSFQSSL